MLRIHCTDHRQGIDEQADLLFHPRNLRGTPGHRSTKGHHRLATSIALQQDQPGGLHQCIEGNFVTAGKCLQSSRQWTLQAAKVFAITLDRLCLAAAQAGWRLQNIQLLTPEGFGVTWVALLQPTDVIAITPGRFRHCHTGVALQDFAKQPGIAPAVHQDMVMGIDQLVTLLIRAHQQQARQRRLAQVKTLATLVLLQVLQGQLPLWHAAPVKFFDWQSGIAVDHLARPFQLALPEESAAQNVMGLHRSVPCLLKAQHIQAFGCDADLIDVVARRLLIQGMEQHALLHWRQRVDVLHGIGRHRQRFELLLIEPRQREVRGGHAAIARRAAVFYQRSQFAAKGLAEGFDLLRIEHQGAERPVHL